MNRKVVLNRAEPGAYDNPIKAIFLQGDWRLNSTEGVNHE